MNKLSRAIIFFLVSIFALNIANAFGYFRSNYDVFDFMGMQGFGLFMGLGLVVLAAVAFLFVFWLWMLIDCLKRDFKKEYEKIVWIIVLIFLHLLGAIVYYFVVKVGDRNYKPEKKKAK